MKDDSLRIFRHLEKTGGRGGFDTIVSAAVASYGALRGPSDNQARDFRRLVLPLWDRISQDTKRSMAAALSLAPRVPREIVEKLIAEPVEIAAPFLLSSPTLTEGDRQSLAGRGDPFLRILSGRNDSGKAPRAGHAADLPVPASPPAAVEVPEAERNLPASEGSLLDGVVDEEGVAASESPATGAGERPVAEEVPARGATADSVRETLRRLARPGRRARAPDGPHVLADLVAAAMRGHGDAFYSMLGAMVQLDPAALRRTESDESGERLAVALRALDAKAADAMTVLMMLKPQVGLDVRAFEAMTRYYRALKLEDCAALAPVRRLQAPALQPQYQDLETVRRDVPARAFGRRKSLPADGGLRSKTG